jgi:phosphomannomutase
MGTVYLRFNDGNMTLIASISGIRGTIGGVAGQALTPTDIVAFTKGYAQWVKDQTPARPRVVLGRDGRISGPMVHRLVAGTLQACGVDVVDLGLATTPTTEMAVVHHRAQGGIILTASHNPKQWNALKLLNQHGEFLDAAAGEKVLHHAQAQLPFAEVEALGTVTDDPHALNHHIEAILKHPLTDAAAIRARPLKILIDPVNSVGALALPPLLAALGQTHVELINGEITGEFAHNPEPLEEHLAETMARVKAGGFDVGIVVDPDVDRLAFIDEKGQLFGEEYTLVACADWVLSQRPGPVVSNMSSSKALADLAGGYGQRYASSPVGEVNVVLEMKRIGAVIGGEGNGGIIVPDLHFGRDALVGIAFFLSRLAHFKGSVSELRATYPQYTMAKKKIDLPQGISVDALLERFAEQMGQSFELDQRDGVKVLRSDGWIHLRKSNTEPIIRIYTEQPDQARADALATQTIQTLQRFLS